MEQNRDLMDKNRIRGRPGRTSGPKTAKSTVIKDRDGKFGRCAGKAVESYLGRSPPCPGIRTERVARPVIVAEKSAEGIVGRKAEGPNVREGK